MNPSIIRKIMFVFAFLILFFMAGFRYGLETDYWTYYHEFYGMSSRKLEFSFNLLMNIVKAITNDYNAFLIVFSFITLGLKFKLFSKYKFFFSILLIYYVRFFVQFDLNAIRQGLAITVVFFALEQLKTNKLKNYFALILFAATIHSSALVLLVLPLVKNIKVTSFRVVLGLIFAVLFRLYLLDKIIGLFSHYLPSVFTSNFSLISNFQYILNNDTSNGFAILPYIRILLPTACLYYLTKGTDNEFYFKSYYIGAIINLAFFGMDTIGFRLAAYFFAAEILIMGQLYNTVIPSKIARGKVNLKNIILLFTIIACDMWTFFSLLSTSETLVPFKTFLSSGMNP